MLCDFGLSKALEAYPSGLTTDDNASYTLRYAAPELLVNSGPSYNLARDIWAWGCFLSEVCVTDDILPLTNSGLRLQQGSCHTAIGRTRPPSCMQSPIQSCLSTSQRSMFPTSCGRSSPNVGNRSRSRDPTLVGAGTSCPLLLSFIFLNDGNPSTLWWVSPILSPSEARSLNYNVHRLGVFQHSKEVTRNRNY